MFAHWEIIAKFFLCKDELGMLASHFLGFKLLNFSLFFSVCVLVALFLCCEAVGENVVVVLTSSREEQALRL